MSDRPNDTSVLRILDANFNRAREALRVMEEYARFVLDDGSLSAAIKEARHKLTSAVARGAYERERIASPGPKDLGHPADRGSDQSAIGNRQSAIMARDIEGDVGREITTPTESERASVAQVALASAARLSEALRVIEEYGKVFDSDFAADIERLRYRGYELQRRLAITSRARERLATVRLYVIVTESLCRGDWFGTARAALEGGADCLQLREKELPDRELLERAKRLAELCHERGKMLIVNDRPDIAAAAGADGVHLGQGDLPVAAARRILPTTAIVGVSTHTVEQIEAAAAQAPDYIAVGPMFATPTKSQERIAGPATLAAARRMTSLPLVAIGGIDLSNAAQVLQAAPCILCICHAAVASPDVSAALAALRALIGPPAAS